MMLWPDQFKIQPSQIDERDHKWPYIPSMPDTECRFIYNWLGVRLQLQSLLKPNEAPIHQVHQNMSFNSYSTWNLKLIEWQLTIRLNIASNNFSTLTALPFVRPYSKIQYCMKIISWTVKTHSRKWTTLSTVVTFKFQVYTGVWSAIYSNFLSLCLVWEERSPLTRRRWAIYILETELSRVYLQTVQ